MYSLIITEKNGAISYNLLREVIFYFFVRYRLNKTYRARQIAIGQRQILRKEDIYR